MDALALLCTLYGEGPKTRARLAEAGWDSIELVRELDAGALASALETTLEGARRFQREARALAERLGLEADPEDADLPSVLRPRARETVGTEEPAVPAPPGAPPKDGEARAAAPRAGQLGELEAATPTRIFEQVLERWRELDREEDREPEAWIPRPEEPSQGPAQLAPGAFPELTPELVRVLGRAGVSTLRGLATSDALELAKRTERALGDCLRWTFLARRALQARAPAATAAPKLSPAELPRSAKPQIQNGERAPRPEDAGGAAGPFA